jgi:hypothetical protein
MNKKRIYIWTNVYTCNKPVLMNSLEQNKGRVRKVMRREKD